MSQDNINSAQSQPLRNPLNLRNLTTNSLSMFDVRHWYNIWTEAVQNNEIVENAGIRPVTTVRSCPLCQTNVEDMRLTLRPAEYEGSPCYVCAQTSGFTEPGQTGGWIFVPDIKEFVDELRMEIGLETMVNDEQHPPVVEGQIPEVVQRTPKDVQQPPVVERQSPEVKQQTPQDEATTITKTLTVRKTKTTGKSSTVRKTPTTSKPTKRKAASPASKNLKK